MKLDNSQAPVHLEGETFRFWTQGTVGTGDLEIIFLKETWSYTSPEGEELFDPAGAYEDADGDMQQTTPDSQADHPGRRPLLRCEVCCRYRCGDRPTTRSTPLSRRVRPPWRLSARTTAAPLAIAIDGTPTYLGNGIFRYYFDNPGRYRARTTYTVTFAAGAWQDSAGVLDGENNNTGGTAEFTVVMPTAQVAGPFTAQRPGDRQPCDRCQRGQCPDP